MLAKTKGKLKEIWLPEFWLSHTWYYDAAKTPRSDVDYSLSPPPRSSVRTACARSSVASTPAATDPAPAPADRPMDTG